MILYLDASALVKRYVHEAGTDDVARAIAGADVVGTSLISRAETAAALAKALRVGALEVEEAKQAMKLLRGEWPDYVRIQVTEILIARADVLAWEQGLRGYDAVQLASALVWHESLQQPVVFATYDRRLWRSAAESGLACFPEALE